jgi:kynurenine formamidase
MTIDVAVREHTGGAGVGEMEQRDRVLAAMRLVREGKVYALAHSLGPSVPHLCDGPTGAGSRFAMQMREWDFGELPMKCFSESVSFDVHTGTHIDALGHWSRNGHAFGGVNAEDNFTPIGLKRLTVDEIPPLIGRGVLIDVAGYKGAEALDGGVPIHPEALEGALRAQGCALRGGDIALFRTGWSHHWGDAGMYMGSCPGLAEEAARWLADRGCIAIGSDQWDVDVVPPTSPEKALAVHALCLADRGIYLIENLRLDELAAEHVYEFCFLCLVPPISGASGFPAQVIAVT